jgi:hypothetical protein
MTDINSINQEYLDFAFVGLDHGINSIIDNGGPLIPFVITETEGQRNIQRFVTENYEHGPILAEKYLKELSIKPLRALIAFDGFVTLDGEKTDAIIIRCFDHSEKEGIILAQRYVRKLEGKGIEPIGNATFLGTEENLIKTTEPQVDTNKPKKPWWKF